MYKHEVIEHVIPRKKTIEECNAMKYNNMLGYDIVPVKENPNIEIKEMKEYYGSLDYYEGDTNNKFLYNKFVNEKDYGELMDYLLLQPHYKYMSKEILYYYCRTLCGLKLTKNDYRKIAKQEKKEVDKMKTKEKVNFKKKGGEFVLRF